MRRLLTEESEVKVIFLGATEDGVVERMEDGGRIAIVVTESGSVLRCQLMASGHYITQDRSARLDF